MDLTLVDYATIAAAALFAAALSGLGGFGGSFIIVFAMSPIVGVKAVIPLLSVFAVFSNLSRVWYYRHEIDYRVCLWFFLASLPGVWVGTRIFANADEEQLKAIIGITLVIMVPMRRVIQKYGKKLNGPGMMAVFAFIFGVVSGTSVGAGLFALVGLMNIGLYGAALLGTDAVIGVATNFSRGMFYAFDGFMTFDLLLAGILMGVMTIPGTWAAAQIVNRLDVKIHTRLLEILIVGGGLYFVIDAFFA